MPRAATATSRTAVNQRAYRKRIAVGVAISPTPCDGRVLDYLIKLGWLDEHDVVDRDKVGKRCCTAVIMLFMALLGPRAMSASAPLLGAKRTSARQSRFVNCTR